MKKYFIVLTLFISQSILSQIKESEFVGHYINHWETPKENIGVGYQKDSISINKKWGRNLFFKEDGTFVDRYFAPCGSDRNIHKYKGKWKLVDDVIKIYDLKENYNKANIYPKEGYKMLLKTEGAFKIRSYKSNYIVLETIDNYEQWIPKNEE